MSIFTHTTDTAIERFTLDDGTEVAVGYDECSPNPVEDWGWGGIAAVRDDRNSIASGDTDLIRAHEMWHEERDEIENDLEYGWITQEEYDERMADLGECSVKRFEYVNQELWGWPTFLIYVDTDHGHTFDSDEDYANWIGNVYSQWAEGQVFMIEVTHPDGETEHVGGIYGDVDESNVRDFL